MGGFLLMQRLVRTCTTNVRQQGYRRHLHPKVRLVKRNIRLFGTGPNGESSDGGDTYLPARSTPLQKPWLAKRRPLSPLERISQMLPEDSLSPDVVQLRGQTQEEEDGGHTGAYLNDHSISDVSSTDAWSTESLQATRQEYQDAASEHAIAEPCLDASQRDGVSEQESGCVKPVLPGERLLTAGELVIAEYHEKMARRADFKKMFQLEEEQKLGSSWGTIAHGDIMGRPSGVFVRTNLGVPFFIRRPSLEEYVLHMKRGPTISYPKDVSAMLTMMDVSEGDCVLEAGSGSGCMSLFLSRAVGSRGSVMSVEIREDHHKRALKNYARWRAAWSLRRGEDWPDNVQFLHADLLTAPLLVGRGFHSIALDMLSPHIVLPTVTPHLHPGAVCVVYLANITQVTDLLEGVRCTSLPLLCERVFEVQIRDWLVKPALHKDQSFCQRKPPMSEGSHEEGEPSDEERLKEVVSQQHPPFGSIPYIARPHPEQFSHTAFLVKLRKCVK